MAAGLASTTGAGSLDAHPPLRVQVGTFNFNLQGTTTPFPDLQPWLVPTISEKRNEYSETSMSQGREAPDIYAVGFQELLPLHSAFANSQDANEIREHTSREIRRAVRHHAAVTRPDGKYPAGAGPEDYTLIAQVHLVSISLYVFGRNRANIPSRVKEVRTSTASTGLFNIIGNKGAVGVRLVLSSELPGTSNITTESTTESLTFVCAHLTAHDHNTLRRNQDYQTIVSRIAFTPDSAIALPIPSHLGAAPDLSKGGSDASTKAQEHFETSTKVQKVKAQQAPTGRSAALDKKTYSLYDTNHVFFFGDLNYRIALDGKALSKQDVQRKLGQGDYAYLSKHDQLIKQHGANKVLHGLHEHPLSIAKIAPTYKYKPVRRAKGREGSEDGTKKSNDEATAATLPRGDQLSGKRIPGWTDRIFWASGGGGGGGGGDTHSSSGTSVELFRSIMSYTISDHKPVTALLRLSRPAPTLLTPCNPYKVDGNHATYRALGSILDRIVGLVWSTLVLMGAGNILLGLSQIVVFVALAVYFVLGRNAGGGDLGYWLASLGLRP